MAGGGDGLRHEAGLHVATESVAFDLSDSTSAAPVVPQTASAHVRDILHWLVISRLNISTHFPDNNLSSPAAF